MSYAKDTIVPAMKSQSQITAMLRKAGADPVGIMDGNQSAIVQFEMQNRRLQFRIYFPPVENFLRSPTGRQRRTMKQAAGFRDQEVCRRWRALYLAIKAKLVAIDDGIETFEQAFMPHIVMPDGRTVGEHIVPKIEQAYETGHMPPLLPGPAT